MPPTETNALEAALAAVPHQGGYVAKYHRNCPEFVAKENAPEIYPADLKDPYSDFVLSLMSNGVEFEDHIGRRVLTEAVDPSATVMIEEVTDANGERTVEGKRDKEAATFAALIDPKVRVIFNARIGSHLESLWAEKFGAPEQRPTPRVSEPDMLVRPGSLWLPVDVKDHGVASGKTVKPKMLQYSQIGDPTTMVGEMEIYGQPRVEDWMQLAHYWRHMTEIGVLPEGAETFGAVIGREEVLVWDTLDNRRWFGLDANGARRKMSALELYDQHYAGAREVIARARLHVTDSQENPWPTAPLWATECGVCPWSTVCRSELQAAGPGGHISLLPGITSDKVAVHAEQGITSTGQLAALGLWSARVIDDLLAPTTVTERLYLEAGAKGVTRQVAQALVSWHGQAALAPDHSHVELARADIEIDFDCEADTSGRGDAHVYMWGVRVENRVPGSEKVDLHTFASYERTDDVEREVFVATWNLFHNVIAHAEREGLTVRVYHYTAFERTQMVRLADKYAGMPGVPPAEEVEQFYDTSGYIVDLYKVLPKQVVWPTKSHSLKPLALFVGFSWRDETPGGDESLVWFRRASTDEDPTVRESNRERLRLYNEDDVHAQAAIRDWLSERGLPGAPGSLLPQVETLAGPSVEELAASA